MSLMEKTVQFEKKTFQLHRVEMILLLKNWVLVWKIDKEFEACFGCFKALVGPQALLKVPNGVP